MKSITKRLNGKVVRGYVVGTEFYRGIEAARIALSIAHGNDDFAAGKAAQDAYDYCTNAVYNGV